MHIFMLQRKNREIGLTPPTSLQKYDLKTFVADRIDTRRARAYN